MPSQRRSVSLERSVSPSERLPPTTGGAQPCRTPHPESTATVARAAMRCPPSLGATDSFRSPPPCQGDGEPMPSTVTDPKPKCKFSRSLHLLPTAKQAGRCVCKAHSAYAPLGTCTGSAHTACPIAPLGGAVKWSFLTPPIWDDFTLICRGSRGRARQQTHAEGGARGGGRARACNIVRR